MKIKNYIITALMLAMGFIFHATIPGIAGMKFDLLLIFMIMAIILNPDIQNVIVSGLGGGIITALTTTFPGGQIPNFIDKIITALFVYALIEIMKNFKNDTIKSAILVGLGTFVSGSVFLSTAYFLVGLPVGFSILMMSVVIPTCIANIFMGLFVYKAITIATKRTITH